jgi:hypothetical protein
VSLVLVVARPGPVPDPVPEAGLAAAGGRPRDPAADEVWSVVRREVRHLRGKPSRAFVPGRLDELADALDEADTDPTVSYATSANEAILAVDHAISAGATRIAILPVALGVEDGEGLLAGPDADDLASLHRGLDERGRRHPGVEISYVGPPFDDAPALEAAIAALRPTGSDEPALFSAAVERGFDGDLDRFARFMRTLQDAVPPETRLILRGSAVQGESYKTGEPFDARGPGTSDLDIVLIGDAAMAAWLPEAFYVPGVNTRPLWDEARDVAPGLEPAREAAQEIAGRPVALQAMARWFLELRSGLQGTPYVTLGG